MTDDVDPDDLIAARQVAERMDPEHARKALEALKTVVLQDVEARVVVADVLNVLQKAGGLVIVVEVA